MLKQLWTEETGQDLVEYALLAAFIGLASYLGFSALQTTLAGSYGTWDANQQQLACPPDPGQTTIACP